MQKVLEYLEFTQLSNQGREGSNPSCVLEYLEFTQLSNGLLTIKSLPVVLEYLEFTQLSNNDDDGNWQDGSFRVPGIYTALKPQI